MAVNNDYKSITRWRNVFLATEDGKKVLEELLVAGGVFQSKFNPELVGFCNWILYKCGILVDKNVENIIDLYAKLPIVYEKTEEPIV